jgi:hypothetical protein
MCQRCAMPCHALTTSDCTASYIFLILQDDRSSPEYNVPARVDAFVSAALEWSNQITGSDVLMMMGSDFHYANAHAWFINLDRCVCVCGGGVGLWFQLCTHDDGQRLPLRQRTRMVHEPGQVCGVCFLAGGRHVCCLASLEMCGVQYHISAIDTCHCCL